MYCIHELVVKARQVDSVAQLVRALHWNRRTAGSIPARWPIYKASLHDQCFGLGTPKKWAPVPKMLGTAPLPFDV